MDKLLTILPFIFHSLSSFAIEECDDRYCLHTYESQVNFGTLEEAQEMCKKGSSWLLEVYDERVSILVKRLNEKLPADVQKFGVLLGMERAKSGWQWTNGHDLIGEVDDQEYSKKLVAALRKTSDGVKYEGKQFESKHYVICNKMGTTHSCPGWLYKNDCYYNISTSSYWYEAHNLCIKNQSSMATFENMALSELKDLTFINDDTSRYWIGLTQGTWKWMKTGVYVTFNQWGGVDILSGHTKTFNGTWKAGDNIQETAVVCMSENKKSTGGSNVSPSANSISTSITSKSTVTLSNDSLSTNAMIGIGVGIGSSALILVVISSVLYFIYFKPSKSRNHKNTVTSPEHETGNTMFARDDDGKTPASESHYAQVTIGGTKKSKGKSQANSGDGVSDDNDDFTSGSDHLTYFSPFQ